MGTSTELTQLNYTPAIVKFDFEAAKKRVEEQVKPYEVAVTEDTLADSKKLATELNKMAGDAKAKKKEVIDSASAPIKEFDTQVKELIQVYLTARENLLKQIKVYEDKKRDEARAELFKRRNELWDKEGVDAEFRTADIEDLIALNTLTKTGNLSKGANDKLTDRVRANKAMQTNTENRLLKLENQSFRAGLKSPLTRAHVETFLFDDEETYQQKLDGVLGAELKRQEETEARVRQDIEREQQREAEAAQAAPEPEPQPEPEQAESHQVKKGGLAFQYKQRSEEAPLQKYALQHDSGADAVFIESRNLNEVVIAAATQFPVGKTTIWLPHGAVAEVIINHL